MSAVARDSRYVTARDRYALAYRPRAPLRPVV